MPLISELLKAKDLNPAAERKIYGLFQQAAKRGVFPALKLLTRFEITGATNQPRAVFDYAVTNQNAPEVVQWITQQATAPRVAGVTAQDAQGMTDEQLQALIAQQRAKRPARSARKPSKAPKKSAMSHSPAAQEVQQEEARQEETQREYHPEFQSAENLQMPGAAQ